jgi:hypothetical protein
VAVVVNAADDFVVVCLWEGSGEDDSDVVVVGAAFEEVGGEYAVV